MRTVRAAATLLLAAGAAWSASRVQTPDASWATIRTAHYRLHYPVHGDFEGFAQEAARRIEGYHQAVTDLVGHAYAGPTDVVIQDPFLVPNGMVFPQLRRPHMVLWRRAPESDLEIAHAEDWIQALLPHELVHLHHLTWPNRRPRWWEKLAHDPLRVSAVTRKSPAWVHEGYATLLEGQLTGQGRPHSAFRAMALRQWAVEGRLPTYKALSAGNPIIGGLGRYLISSAFLGWLEQSRPGSPRVLRDLWTRLSSPRYPTFNDAFKATFGELPEFAYARFCAELTHGAVEMEQRLKAKGLREGEIFTATAGVALDLSVSPDGKRLLAQTLAPKRAGLWVWDLDAPLASAKAREHAKRKDPELPAEAAEVRPEREVARRLTARQFTLPERPRWEKAGIRYRHRRFTDEGTLAFEEALWAPGPSQPENPAVAPFWPTWQPDGAWIIQVDGKPLRLPFTPFGMVSWDRPRGWLYASREVQGVLNLVRVKFDPAASAPFGAEEILTRTASGAAYPAPTPDGKALYFSRLGTRGVEIRRLDLTLPPLDPSPWAEEESPLAPGTVRSQAKEPSRLPPPGSAPEPHPYRVSESHLAGLRVGLTWSPSGKTYLLGAGGNDILGRLDWTALASIGAEQGALGPRGASAGGTWRGWAWQPRLQAFSQLERPSAQKDGAVAGFDLERRGLALGLLREGRALDHPWSLGVDIARERVERREDGRIESRSLVSPRLMGAFAWNRGALVLRTGATLQGAWGRTEESTWNLWRAGVTGSVSFRGHALEASAEKGRLGGRFSDLDRFSLGGQTQGLLPQVLEANQVFQPALAARSAMGDRLERWRVQAEGLFYLEGIAVWDASQRRPVHLRVAGLELATDTRALPVFFSDSIRRRLGHVDLGIGVHRILNGPSKDRTIFTARLIARF